MEKDDGTAATTAAAIRYHGKTKPPPPTRHMAEFEAIVTRSSGTGLLLPSSYRLENVTGKLVSAGQDVLTYRVHIIEPADYISLSESVNVRVAPLGPHRRREGRPEVGFWIPPHEQVLRLEEEKRPAFIHEVAYDLVLDVATKSRIAEIYFEIEDCNVTLLPKDAKRDMSHAPASGGPLWRLGVDTSMLLAETTTQWTNGTVEEEGEPLKAVWIPLTPIHPDPAIDPGVPIQRRPQRKPRWYWYRSQGPEQLGGKLSGTKWWKLLGKFPDNWDKDKTEAFKGNPLTRSGRMLEGPVALAYMMSQHHLPGTRLMECGSFPHPTIPDVMASPDAVIIVPAPGRLPPKWFKDQHTPEQLAKMDFTRGVWECKTMMTLDSRGRGPLFKEEHVPQVFAEMICAGVYWAELTRYCKETNEMRTFRVFRTMALSAKFEAMLKRMRNELVGGTPFTVACDHPTNLDLITQCTKHAVYFNKDPERFFVSPWPSKEVTAFVERCASYDVVAGTVDDPTTTRTIEQANDPTPKEKENGKKKAAAKGRGKGKKEPPKKNDTKKKTASKKKRARDDCGDIERDNVESVAKCMANSSIPKRWTEIAAANQDIEEAFQRHEIGASMDRLLEMQVVRYTRLMRDVTVWNNAQELDAEIIKYDDDAAAAAAEDDGEPIAVIMGEGDDEEEEEEAVAMVEI